MEQNGKFVRIPNKVRYAYSVEKHIDFLRTAYVTYESPR